jgi:WD40 repeat protein
VGGFWGEPWSVAALSFAHDRLMIVEKAGVAMDVSARSDGRVRVFDLLDQPELFHDAVEAGGRHVANRVTELDPIVVPKPPTALVVSPTVEQSVVVGSADGAVWMVRRHSTAKGRRARIEVGDLETSEMLRLRRSRNGGAVTRLAYSRDGKRLAAGWEMGEFLVFDTDAMVPVASFSVADQYGGHVVDFAPVGDVIALGGGREGHAAFYDLEVGTVVSKPWNLVPPRHYRCEPPMERWLRELERYRVGPLNNETADDDTVMSKCFAICRNDESVPSHRQVSTMDGIREHMRDAGSWIRIKEGIYDVKTAASQHLLLRQLSGSAILDGKGVDATHYLETLGLQGQLSAACTSHTLVALAYGATVEMQERITGKRLWVHTFDDLVEAFSVPMAIRPGVDKGAGQIACVLGKQGGQVAVLDRRRGQRTKAIHAEYESAQIGTAHEVYRTAAHDGHVCEVTYSPDGKWLLVCGAFGVCVYCADTGALHPEMTPEPAVEPRGRRRSVTMAYIQGHGQGRTNSCAMSPDGKWIATVGREGAAQVREVQSGQPVHGAAIATTGSTHSVSFSSNGKSLVYWLCADRHNDPGQVVIADTSTWNEQRFSVKNWKEARVEFSPLEQYLLVVNRDGHFAILDRKGHELPWSDIVRPLLLPFGRVVANSVHWISTCEGTAETSWSRVRSMDSRLQAVVGNQLLVIDLGDAIEASDNDCGCTCTVEQLVNLTANEPSLIQRLTASNPHLVNVRDRQSGDTVLHYCAKNELVDEVTSWLSQPLSAFTPVKNKIDITAAHIAVDTQNRRLLLQLMNSLDSNSMNHVTSEHVCAVLRAVAIKMPEAVRQCLECVQTRLLVQKKDIFRATFPRGAEVLAFDSVTGEESVVRYDDRLGQFQGKWQQTLSRTSDDVAAVRKVLLVREFVGRAGVSPFHEIVNRCDSSVFYCQIMALAVQYKWEAEIYPQVKVEIVVYVVHMLLASTAMIVATKFNQFPVLVPLMVGAVVCECVFVVRLVTKLSTMYRARSEEDSLNQRRSGIHLLEWESLDCIGTICFTLGAFGFFVQTPHLLRAAGSFGVFCKWLRVFGYMRAWAFTGSLVRMIVVIAWDILPFLTILLFLMVGFAIFFVINLPETGVAPANPFGYNPQVLGPLWPPYTVFGMALGSVDIEDHLSSWSAITMHMFLRLFVTILLLNLLIAIMQDSYRRVEEHEVVAGLHEKAKMIRTFELRKPTRKCALYMHIVEPVEVAVTSTNNNTVALDKRMQDIEEQQCAISEHLKKISEQLKHKLAS